MSIDLKGTSILIDEKGYRSNVGIILMNHSGQLLWARRANTSNAWQFPQGGIHEGETLQQAMFRELHEELGLQPQDVEIVLESQHWYSYILPMQFRRYDRQPLCIGQKQKWFLLRLISSDDAISLMSSEKPEFDRWQWVDYHTPESQVISFKRNVYRQAIKEFESYIKLEIEKSQIKK